MTETRTAASHDSPLYLQGGVAFIIFAVFFADPGPSALDRWAQYGFLAILIGSFVFLLRLPRTRVDVTAGVIAVHKINLWGTLTYEFMPHEPPPEMTIREMPSRKRPAYILELMLPNGEKIQIAQSRVRDVVLGKKVSLLALWTGLTDDRDAGIVTRSGHGRRTQDLSFGRRYGRRRLGAWRRHGP